MGIASNDEIRRSGIFPEYAAALHDLTKSLRPSLALEVGMAGGVSTEAILSALPPNGKLISIDPLQSTYFQNAGRTRVTQYAAQHIMIEKPDYLVLPELIAQGTQVSLAYIDGHHSFDYVFIDFFLIDKLLPIGGIVGFNDCQMPSISKVISFLSFFRRYKEISVGLQPLYTGRWRHFRRAFNCPPEQDRYFEKKEQWLPQWDFHHEF